MQIYHKCNFVRVASARALFNSAVGVPPRTVFILRNNNISKHVNSDVSAGPGDFRVFCARAEPFRGFIAARNGREKKSFNVAFSFGE